MLPEEAWRGRGGASRLGARDIGGGKAEEHEGNKKGEGRRGEVGHGIADGIDRKIDGGFN
jgi:hypothetical protein